MRRFVPVVMLVMLVMLAATGCKSGNPHPNPSDDGTDTRKNDRKQAGEWLVWRRTNGGHETSRVRQQGDGFVVVETFPELFVGTSEPDGIWRVEVVDESRDMVDCDCWSQHFHEHGAAPSEDECVTQGTVDVLQLADPVAGRHFRAESEPLRGATYEVEITVDASSGPLVFSRRCTDVYVCGAAHPNVTCEAEIWNLRHGTTVELDRFGGPPEVRERAIELLQQEHDDVLEDLDPATVEMTYAHPEFDPADGEVVMVRQYSAPTCNACADGEWDSYTVSVSVRSEPPPVASISSADIVSVTPGTPRGMSPVPASLLGRGMGEVE